jgi:hypothetical protein
VLARPTAARDAVRSSVLSRALIASDTVADKDVDEMVSGSIRPVLRRPTIGGHLKPHDLIQSSAENGQLVRLPGVRTTDIAREPMPA